MFEEEIASILNEEDAPKRKLPSADEYHRKVGGYTKIEFQLLFDKPFNIGNKMIEGVPNIAYEASTHMPTNNLKRLIQNAEKGDTAFLTSLAGSCDNLLDRFFEEKMPEDSDNRTRKQTVRVLKQMASVFVDIPDLDVGIRFDFSRGANKFKVGQWL